MTYSSRNGFWSMKTHKIILSWHEGKRTWVAVSQSHDGKATARSPKTAVNRLKKTLAVFDRAPAQFEVVTELPSGALGAVAKYLNTMSEAAEKRRHALTMQVELAQLFITRYGLNRSQAAAAVGLTTSYLGKLLDGKVVRGDALETRHPAVTISDFVNTYVRDRKPFKRNVKKR